MPWLVPAAHAVALVAGCAAGAYLTRDPAGATARIRVHWDRSARRLAHRRGPLVYVVRRDGTDEVKVGCTTSTRAAASRVEDWATGTPGQVTVEGLIFTPDAEALEQSIHDALRPHHLHREWFRLSATDHAWRRVVEGCV